MAEPAAKPAPAPAPAPKSDVVTPEDLLKESMGHFGCYQLFIIFLLYLHRFGVGFHQLVIVLHSPPPGDFNCTDPEYKSCDPDCPSHEFDHSVWDNTIIHQWDLVCNKKYLNSVVQCLTMLGILFGNIIFGYLGDKFGRVYPLATAATLQLVAGVSAGFSPWYWLFALLRFTTGLATGGTMVPSFALLIEFTPKKWRTLIGIWFTIPVHLGHALLGLVGYLWRRWDYDQIAISAFSMFLMTYWCCLPESPRWLLNMKKDEKVVKVLQRGAKCNKMPTEHIKPLVDKYVAQQEKIGSTGTGAQGNFKDLFKTVRMRTKTLVMCLNWFSTALAFYAIGQYVGRIGGNIFVNVAAVGLMQVPANILGSIVVGIIGRKWTIIGSYLLTIVPMLIVGFLPESPLWPIIVLSITGMCGAAISFSLIYVYSGELFPTTLRSVGMGLCSMTGRVGSMIAPYIFDLPIPEWVRPILFVVSPIISTVLSFIFLPETMNQLLAESVEDADKL